MRKILLMSSALALLSGTVEAGCIQTPSCSSLGYSSTTACEGGLKCPWGNAWFCNVGGGGSGSNPDYSNCKIGDILYSDMSCNANMIASKTPIGVIFDTTNHLAVAKDEFSNLMWGMSGDISGIQNYANSSTSTADWQGFNNTKAIHDFEKSQGGYYPLMRNAVLYSTTGTSQGQWYVPAAGELQSISSNKDVLNTTLLKIGGTQMSGGHWSSSEKDGSNVWTISMGGSMSATPKVGREKLRPIINYASADKLNVDLNKIYACNTGDILYSDKTCSANVVSGKTPIGVVFDGTNRLATSLYSSSSLLDWGGAGTDIPGITNIGDPSKAKQDFNGKANTAVLISYASGAGFPAAKYAYEYKTEGTKAGDWYLPAMGELYELYQNKEAVNNALTTFGYPIIPENPAYWSSSENFTNNAWALYIGSGGVVQYHKSNKSYVRPVLAF